MATTLYTLDVPDEPGTLGRVAGIMNDAGINIDAFAAGKGGLRIITGADTDTAGALQAAGIAFTATEVIEIELPNQPGALAGVAQALGDHGVNIETSFGAAKGQDGGSIYIGVDDVDKAWEALEAISTA